jgi:hypothetical protein
VIVFREPKLGIRMKYSLKGINSPAYFISPCSKTSVFRARISGIGVSLFSCGPSVNSIKSES